MSTDALRAELEEELSHLIAKEKEIDGELSQYFEVIAEGKAVTSGLSYESSSDLSHSLVKIEQFAPCFEVMTQGSSKLVNQVEECRALSDRLSMMVRRLDTIQIRAQEALACTEDVINMKDCKISVLAAIEERNLPLAVSYIKQVHDIDEQAAKASDDYLGVLEAEKEVCNLVRAEFGVAIQNSDIDLVLKLCPLLQTVGLEVEARDTFISFMEDNIFISISADAADIDATDHATAYAQTLASIFNNACLIYQQYLPVVIQGMEKSDGDVVFIRRLHSKCSKESGLVLKRYMKFRNVKNCIAAVISSSDVLSRLSNNRRSKISSSKSLNNQPLPSPAEMHQILDEIAIILQYCCSYGQYVKLLCNGAESRPREHSEGLNIPQGESNVLVFNGPSDFDQMVDELINSYYVEGEHWLMLWGIECVTKAVKKTTGGGKSNLNKIDTADFDVEEDDDSGDFDGCFFVLQRCSQRAIATNNINAACAILHFMTDHLSNDLLQYLTTQLDITVSRFSEYVKDVMNNILKSNTSATDGIKLSGIAKLSLSKGIQNVFSSGLTSGKVAGGEHQKELDDTGNADIVEAMEIFNSVELCARYTASLRKEISSSSQEVFGSDASNVGTDGMSFSTSDSLAKINMSLENFDECKECFMHAVNNAATKLTQHCQYLMQDVLSKVLGEIHFEYDGDKFDSQEAVQLVPKVLVGPFDILLRICTESLNDSNKDLLLVMLSTAYANTMEKFISEKKFSFAGSIKLEECVRALNNSFAQISTVSLRSKFSRLREVLLVLSSDTSMLPSAVANSSKTSLPLTQLHNLSQLTEAEAHTYLTLRTDFVDYQL